MNIVQADLLGAGGLVVLIERFCSASDIVILSGPLTIQHGREQSAMKQYDELLGGVSRNHCQNKNLPKMEQHELYLSARHATQPIECGGDMIKWSYEIQNTAGCDAR